MLITSSILIFLSALISLIFGLTYLFRTKYMNYHSDAVTKKWGELDTKMQTLILALMRVAAGGLLSVSLTIIFLQYKFIELKEQWIAAAILICGGILTVCILYATNTVIKKTTGKPPRLVVWAALIFLIAGYFLNIAS